MPFAAAETIGFDARKTLSSGAGEIAAVFRRSFYVRIGEGWACGGSAEIGRGPLNLLLRADRDLDWRTLLTPGQAAGVHQQRLWIKGHPPIDLACAEVWTPPPAPAWHSGSVRTGLAELDRLLDTLIVPEEGLACFARTGGVGRTLVSRGAEASIRALAIWLTEGRSDPVVDGLLGLGPGLTPSGDDFLAGVLAVLHAIGRCEMRDRLWSAIESHLSSSTGQISAAHLRCAAEGRLAAGQHAVLHALLTGNGTGLKQALQAFSIDHTSSWDGLGGMATALRALANASQ